MLLSKNFSLEGSDLTFFNSEVSNHGYGITDINPEDARKERPHNSTCPIAVSNSFAEIQFLTNVKFEGGSERRSANGEIKPHSTPATLHWLAKNYELAEGICIPRNTLYSHYVHFCKTNRMSPLNSASFGKIIRQAFPSLTTRRLGTRGQSQYHYCGVAIRDTSPYYEIAFSKMIFTCDGKKPADNKISASIVLTRNKENLKIWPSFPSISEISFPPHVSEEKVNSFMIMYHTHCQRMFDTIVRGTLDDAYQFFEHFWQGVPPHLSELLSSNTVVNMVGACDSILYKTISRVLMPSVLKRCSDDLICMIRNFAGKLETWMNLALNDIPENLKSVKLKLGRRFCTILRRQMLLYQLTRTAQVVLNNCEMMNHINKDWKRINLGPITRQALLFTDHSVDHVEIISQINGYWMNFRELIERQAAIEDFTEIVETIVQRCIADKSEIKQIPLRKVARTFILLWHVIESLISRDMTIHSASSFGSFHLIQTMFDEYLHYLVEMLYSEEVTKYLIKNVSLDVLPDLDAKWKAYDIGNCNDFLDASTSSLQTITTIAGDNLEGLQDFQNNSFLNCSTAELGCNLSKSSGSQSETLFINGQCEYSNVREEIASKFNFSTLNQVTIPLGDFNACDPNCIEFSAGIFGQEAIQYNSESIQYQDNNFAEGSAFDCLE